MFYSIRSWLERSANRQRELAEGADADLVRTNRRRWLIALALVALSLALAFGESRLKLPDSIATAIGFLIAASGVVGIVLAQWAWNEYRFLNKPDPEAPPKIFDDKK